MGRETVYCFFERGGIGDLLMRIPFYFRMFQMGIDIRFLVSVKDARLFYCFFPKEIVVQYDLNKFNLLSPYRKWVKNKLFLEGKKVIVVVPLTYKHHKLLGAAAKFHASEYYAYEGENSCIVDDHKPLPDVYTRIRNPFIPCPFLIDAHNSKHSQHFFSRLMPEGDWNLEKVYPLVKKCFRSCNESEFQKRLPKSYIVLQSDAGVAYRRYPKERWQLVLDSLPRDISIVQLDEAPLDLFHPGLRRIPDKFLLKSVFQIIRKSRLFLGNDTGFTHFAYLSGVPTVSVLGGGHFGRFFPWSFFDDLVVPVFHRMDCFQCNWQCKYVNLKKEVPPCIGLIEPGQILNAIKEMDMRYSIF